MHVCKHGCIDLAANDLSCYAICMAEWQAVEPRVRKTFLPIFWVEEKSQATPDQCSTFRKQVNRLFSACPPAKQLWLANNSGWQTTTTQTSTASINDDVEAAHTCSFVVVPHTLDSLSEVSCVESYDVSCMESYDACQQLKQLQWLFVQSTSSVHQVEHAQTPTMSTHLWHG